MSLEDGKVDEQLLAELENMLAEATGGLDGVWYHDGALPGALTLEPKGRGVAFLGSEWTNTKGADNDMRLVAALHNHAREIIGQLRALYVVRREAHAHASSSGSKVLAAIDASYRRGR